MHTPLWNVRRRWLAPLFPDVANIATKCTKAKFICKKKLNNPTKQIHFLSLAAQLFAYNAYKFASFACVKFAIPTISQPKLQDICKKIANPN